MVSKDNNEQREGEEVNMKVHIVDRQTGFKGQHLYTQMLSGLNWKPPIPLKSVKLKESVNQIKIQPLQISYTYKFLAKKGFRGV